MDNNPQSEMHPALAGNNQFPSDVEICSRPGRSGAGPRLLERKWQRLLYSRPVQLRRCQLPAPLRRPRRLHARAIADAGVLRPRLACWPSTAGRWVRQEYRAWRFGPVIPDLCDSLKQHGANTVPHAIPDFDCPEYDADTAQLVSRVCDRWRRWPGARLAFLSACYGAPRWRTYYGPWPRRPTDDAQCAARAVLPLGSGENQCQATIRLATPASTNQTARPSVTP